jgi:hypothetical protein
MDVGGVWLACGNPVCCNLAILAPVWREMDAAVAAGGVDRCPPGWPRPGAANPPERCCGFGVNRNAIQCWMWFPQVSGRPWQWQAVAVAGRGVPGCVGVCRGLPRAGLSGR